MKRYSVLILSVVVFIIFNACINCFLLIFSCPYPWIGVDCEVRASSSDDMTCKDFCKNGGLCLNGENGPFCHCKSSWTGEHCTVHSSCIHYCFNGGTCQEPADGSLTPTCMLVHYCLILLYAYK